MCECGKVVLHTSLTLNLLYCSFFFLIQFRLKGGSSEPNELPLNPPLIYIYLHVDTHTHTCTCIHIHTHFFFDTPCPLDLGDEHYIEDTGWWWCMKARHLAWSFKTSCQLGRSVRSLLRTSIRCVPPGLLCFPCGQHLSTCFWSWWSGILCTLPSHCNCLRLSWTSTGSSPVSSRMSAFRLISYTVTPMMSQRLLI